jgi:ribosomal protein S18 acetylase RimI-like enzyme
MTQTASNPAEITADDLEFAVAEHEQALPAWANRNTLAGFLHMVMKPYEDTQPDVHAGLEYAFADGSDGRDGFAILAGCDERLVGAVVILKTNMRGYVPENLLLFVAVDPELRNKGIGGRLIEMAIARCEGDVKLHVEPDNPALRLYERVGFTNKYLEMRYSNK